MIGRGLFLAALMLFGHLIGPMALAQGTPFVDPKTANLLKNELSGEIAFDNLRVITRFHRPGGSEGELQAAEFIAEKARQYGLEEVKLITQRSDSPSWTCRWAELWLIEPEEIKLASYEEVATSIADYSRSADVTAELVDVGTGIAPEEYQGKDVRGKIVLASGSPSEVMRMAVWERGAAGIVSYASTRINPWTDSADQIAWQRVPATDGPAGQKTTFAFIVSPRMGLLLRARLGGQAQGGWGRTGSSTAPEKLRVRAVVKSEFKPTPQQWMVEAFIRGSEIHDQQIVLTAHIQEEKFSANDDGSGCVNLLEIGRALVRLMREGKITRPRRDIRFWWTTEISSEYRYFSEHPEEIKKLLVNINQDMVGAKQSIGSRVQHVTRTPYSIPSYLSDVIESITNYVVDTNNAFLASIQAGKTARGSNYTDPVYSRLGTREAFNARVVPYFDSTDHQVFVDSVVGVPGVTLTNWPDEYIHSSDDDLWQIDPTQLKRNAFIVAAAALYIANAGRPEVPRLAAEVYGSALSRLGRDARTALHLIRQADKERLPLAYKDARILIAEAALKEQRALDSIGVFAHGDAKGLELIKWFSDQIERAKESNLTDLSRLYELLSGDRPPATQLSPKEMELAKKIPVRIEGVAEYLAAREKIGPTPGLHPLMRAEVLNFVDGRRSFLQIYHAVRAEALSVGEFYYGVVTLEAVEDVLNKALAAGALKLKD
jgi:hypothetical protein